MSSLTIYALEGFLARLATSPRRDDFVLKGGVLLAAYSARRPTRDIDLLATAQSNDLTVALASVREIAGTDIGDGLHFDIDAATAETIREEDEYAGIRVAITARLATAVLPVHIDINIGDPVAPPAAPIDLPRLLGGTIRITGYPIAMVHAEKIITAIQRGTVNVVAALAATATAPPQAPQNRAPVDSSAPHDGHGCANPAPQPSQNRAPDRLS